MDSSISAKINDRILMLQKEKERVLNNYPSLVYEGEKSISEVLNLVIGMEINFLKELLNNNSDAVEFAEWIGGKYQNIKERWIEIIKLPEGAFYSGVSNSYSTKELYQKFLSLPSNQLNNNNNG